MRPLILSTRSKGATRATRATLATLALLAVPAAPVAALARKPAPAKQDVAAPGDSAAARAARLAAADDTGSVRGGQLRGPALQNGAIATEANAVEHAPIAETVVQRSTGPLSGALEALVAHQMERNAPAFDHCVADAKLRDPSLHGEVTLQMTITAKKPSAVVQGANADAALTSCLVATASTLRVSLPDLSFPWKVSLGTAASTGGARAALP